MKRITDCRLLFMVNLWSISNCIYSSYLLNAIQSTWNQTFVVGCYVWLQLSFGICEIQAIGVAIQVVFDVSDILNIRVTIFINNVYNSLDHLLLRNFVSYGGAVGKIFAEPNFDNSSFVDSDVGLLHLKKISDFLSQHLESIQTLIVEMDDIRIGDVFYICESNWYFFDENSVLIVGWTELMLVVFL